MIFPPRRRKGACWKATCLIGPRSMPARREWEGDTVWAELGPEVGPGSMISPCWQAAASAVARQELFELVEYDLELPKGALSSCNVAVRSQKLIMWAL